jgi:hypothetical protein
VGRPRAEIIRVGVTLCDLTPATERQLDLFLSDDRERQKCETITHMIDGLMSDVPHQGPGSIWAVQNLCGRSQNSIKSRPTNCRFYGRTATKMQSIADLQWLDI